MEYISEKTQKTVKLGTEDKDSIAKKIVEDYDNYDKARSAQLEKAEKLKKEIFFSQVALISDRKEDAWKSTLKTCKIYMYHQILKAFIWKNIYANPTSMFDVSGENLQADKNSNKQKTMLAYKLDKMEYPKTMDKIIDNSLIYGELISFVTWKKQSEEYRRPISFFNGVKDPLKLPKIIAAAAKGEKFYTDEKIVYDAPYIYEVDPANFVFDTTQRRVDWDTCPKINRTWRTPEDIINNKYFEISKEVAEDLRNLVTNSSDNTDISHQDNQSLKDKHTNGSTVEMLEHWGDLTLKDGTVLKNWYAVVVAGKHLVCFEKNPLIINPFSYGAYVVDPDNNRGISLLYPLYDLSATQESMLRRTMDLQALTENPPVYAAKDFFKEPGDIKLSPGKIIEYDPAMYTTNIPVKQLEFNTNVFLNDIEFLDDLMSEISGIFPNMAGATESDRTTATEISTKVEGQLTRLKMLLDVINQYLVLSDVKKLAKLLANFTFGSETVFVNNDNTPENVEITDEIRQAEYRYTYSDRSATSERFNYVDMVAQAVQMFVKSGLQININEFFTWFMEQKGVENPERFLQLENFIDPQVQQVLLQHPNLGQVIQEMQNRVKMAKEGKSLPENEPVAVEQPQAEETLPDKLNSLPGRNLLSA